LLGRGYHWSITAASALDKHTLDRVYFAACLHGTLPHRLTPPAAAGELAETVQTNGAIFDDAF